MEKEKPYYCVGKDERCDCPLKESCLRFKEDLNKKAELWLAWPPYEKDREKCKHYKPVAKIIQM